MINSNYSIIKILLLFDSLIHGTLFTSTLNQCELFSTSSMYYSDCMEGNFSNFWFTILSTTTWFLFKRNSSTGRTALIFFLTIHFFGTIISADILTATTWGRLMDGCVRNSWEIFILFSIPLLYLLQFSKDQWNEY